MNLRTSEPFWLVKNGIIHSYASLKEDVSTDILIVGGGITGSLIAHQLIKDGLNVILIDRRDIGSGSTSATTSMLQYEIDIPLYKLSEMIGKEAAEKAYWSCSDAIDKLEKVAQEIHSKAGFEKKKSLYFAAYKKDVGFENERHMIGIENEDLRITVTQIAGILARRIVSWVTLNDGLSKGELYGMIRFGSCTEVVVPKNVELLVKKGDKVVGGETIIGRIKE